MKMYTDNIELNYGLLVENINYFDNTIYNKDMFIDMIISSIFKIKSKIFDRNKYYGSYDELYNFITANLKNKKYNIDTDYLPTEMLIFPIIKKLNKYEYIIEENFIIWGDYIFEKGDILYFDKETNKLLLPVYKFKNNKVAVIKNVKKLVY